MASAAMLTGSPCRRSRSLARRGHYWRVRSRTASGEVSDFSEVVTFGTNQATTTSADAAASPTVFAVDAVYPNPVSRVGSDRFTTTDASSVRVVLYDALGREQAVLVDEMRAAGVHTVSVEASALPAGVYVLRVQAGAHLQSRAFVVQR